jgi:hypothetical protein
MLFSGILTPGRFSCLAQDKALQRWHRRASIDRSAEALLLASQAVPSRVTSFLNYSS